MPKVAIIPARGGSKRIPRKNIRDFRGKPMLAWSIEAAKRAGCFERIIVSTDDDEIAAVAERCGAEARFRRPAELATDHAGTLEVIIHALSWLRAAGVDPDIACCIYATAPLMRWADILEGLRLLEDSRVDYVFACTTFPYPIQRALRLDSRGRVSMLHPEYETTRSQDLLPVFHDAGQFYWGRSHAFLEGRPVFGPGAIPIMIPRTRVQDIDTAEDWKCAEALHRALVDDSDDASTGPPEAVNPDSASP